METENKFFENDRGIEVTFCRNCRNCPSLIITQDSDTVILGGEEEGFSEWTKEQFLDMVTMAKNGTFDRFE